MTLTILATNMIKNCEQCEKEFTIFPYREKTARFCSFSCRATLMGKGRKMTEETKRKLFAGRDKFVYSKDVRKKMSQIKLEQFANGIQPWNKGKTGLYGEAQLARITEANRKNVRYGIESHNWKGGVSKVHQKLRSSPEYQAWRTDILKRDDYRCMDCGERGGTLQADHIFSFAKYPRLRLDPLNGQTLCKDCHKIKTFPVALTI